MPYGHARRKRVKLPECGINDPSLSFQGYKQQHNAFVQHAASQLQQLEQQKIQLEQAGKLTLLLFIFPGVFLNFV